MAEYTRKAVFFKWDEGVSHFAFRVLREGFVPAEDVLEIEARSAEDCEMLAAGSGNTPRVVDLPIVARSMTSGTANDGVEDVDYGNYNQLLAAWTARIIDVKLFGDTAYWQALWQGDWTEVLDFDGMRKVLTITARLVETFGA